MNQYERNNSILMNEMVALNEMLDTAPRIAEEAFKNRYLPAFLGAYEKFDTRAWLEVSESPFNTVDVIAPDGSLAFRVPPLFKEVNHEDEHLERKIAVSECVARIKEECSNIPRMFPIRLYEELSKIMPKAKSGDTLTEFRSMLTKRYSIKQSTVSNSGVVVDNTLDDVEEFDDF